MGHKNRNKELILYDEVFQFRGTLKQGITEKTVHILPKKPLAFHDFKFEVIYAFLLLTRFGENFFQRVLRLCRPNYCFLAALKLSPEYTNQKD